VNDWKRKQGKRIFVRRAGEIDVSTLERAASGIKRFKLAFLLQGLGHRNEAMAGLALPDESCHKIRLSLAVAVASFLWSVPLPTPAAAADGVFQQAVNYVFTGRIDPRDSPEIEDRKSCVVVVLDPKNKRYARYYLSRFKMDVARISKKYAGRETFYELEVEGDDVILEYLNLDKTTVGYGFKSAHISLPGNIDQTEKALRLIFADHCKADKLKTPF